MEAIHSSETSVDFQRATRRYIPGVRTLLNNVCSHLAAVPTPASVTSGFHREVAGWGARSCSVAKNRPLPMCIAPAVIVREIQRLIYRSPNSRNTQPAAVRRVLSQPCNR
jgi:hypothetical protein